MNQDKNKFIRDYYYLDNNLNNNLIDQRWQKANDLKTLGIDLFPNNIRPSHTILQARNRYEKIEIVNFNLITKDENIKLSLSGRVMAIRSFGKSAFIKIQDSTGFLQVYIKKFVLEESGYNLFQKIDIGDFIQVYGALFCTRTRELTLMAEKLQLVTKSLRALPEKFHGLKNVEQRYRQRYLDLIMNSKVRDIFKTRSIIVSTIRHFFEERDFIEVETPIMQYIPGGGVARPFETFHNALGLKLYLRIAPELYLKRLVVGGLERIFELNRNFRNEGISSRHNPEFTMLEFYISYSDYEDLMSLTEKLFVKCALVIKGSNKFIYQGKEIDFTPPWQSYDFRSSLIEIGGVSSGIIFNKDKDKALDFIANISDGEHKIMATDNFGEILLKLFELLVEPKLWQPTFITGYPRDISPLSRTNHLDSEIVDRFEFFIAGYEIGNGFSELNDPDDQYRRFEDQINNYKFSNDETNIIDKDYIRALEYGMPPTAGEGLGIDRLVMLLTDQKNIREVIFFPLLRPERLL